MDAMQQPTGQTSHPWTLLIQRRGVVPLAMTIGLALVVGVNLWWIFENLRGIPFDIDAAGYLQRAVRDGDALRSGGLAAYIHTIRSPHDIQAPLLTALGGILRLIPGVGVLKLTASLQLFYIITVLCTYFIARHFFNKSWSVLAAIIVASLPAILQVSRDYDFAGPATALFLGALALQLHSENLDRIVPTLTWGVVLGLCSLTRTLMIAFLPALVIMSLPRILLGDHRLRRSLNLLAAVAVALGVASSWYTATWRSVFHYLVNYGYGQNAASYGAASSWLSLGHWTTRIDMIVNEDVFVPLAFALVGSAVIGILYAVARRLARHSGTRPTLNLGTSPSHSLWRRCLAWAASDIGTLVGVLVICYVVLCSTQNGGSDFELPIVPLIVIVLLRIAYLATGTPRVILATCCLLASGLTFANQAGWLLGNYSDVVSFPLGSSRYIAFDERGLLVRYTSEVLGGCPGIYNCISPEPEVPAATGDGRQDAATQTYLNEWLPPVSTATGFMEAFAHAHDREPIVFFAVQDPFFNTNTVALDAQLYFSSQLPIGILNPPSVAGTSYANQLEEPQFGEPNFVIEGPLPKISYSAAFSPDNRQSTIVSVLRREGFAKVKSITLPDGRVLGIWWKDRGASLPG